MSSPTANVVTLSISRKTIIIAVLVTAACLVALGGLLQLLGIRVAVEARPSLARALGGITSTGEQERIRQQYEQQIAQLQGQVSKLVGKVDRLESAKQAIVQLIPAPVPGSGGFGGQGGPLRRILDIEWFAPRAVDGLDRLSRQSHQLQQRVNGLTAAWEWEFDVVKLLPLRSPLASEHQLTSDFGIRRDPFTGGLARHEGLDYVAPYATPIQASAAGIVMMAEYYGAYGLTLEIDHGRGFSSRYAHLSRLDVAKGDQIQAGQLVGLLGTTGRSTGPHLHYEVRLHGQAIDPRADSVLKEARTQVKSEKISLVALQE